MDLNDLHFETPVDSRYGYVYHTVFRKPTTGKIFHYVGQHIGCRLDKKYFGSGTLLSRYFNKHQREGNTKVFLVAWAKNKEELDLKEISAIRQIKKIFDGACLNLLYGGDSNGRHHEATRKKISESKRGTLLSETHKSNISLGLLNMDPEVKAKSNAERSKSLTGRVMSEESILKSILGRRGYKPSDETRKIWSEQRTGRLHSEESKKKMSESRAGKKQTRVICPHCLKSVPVTCANKWHFANCKVVNPTGYAKNANKVGSLSSKKLKGREKDKNTECPHCHKIGDASNMKRWHFDNCAMPA